MHDGKRETRRIIDELVRQGWRVRLNKHYIAYPPDRTKPPVVFASSPSDDRAVANNLSILRKSGARI